MPTLAQLAGVKSPAGIDGVSVVPTLMGIKQPGLKKRFLYWEFYEGGFMQAARFGKWKAVLARYGRPMELFDLSIDEGEQNDVASRHPKVVKMFKTYLSTARTPSKGWPAPVY